VSFGLYDHKQNQMLVRVCQAGFGAKNIAILGVLQPAVPKASEAIISLKYCSLIIQMFINENLDYNSINIK
jgi:hypothetical protein